MDTPPGQIPPSPPAQEQPGTQSLPPFQDEGFGRWLEYAPDPTVVTDEQGRILLVNVHTERVFGYNRDAMIGRPVEMLMPERFRGAHFGHRQSYASAPRTRPMGAGLDLYGLRSDGSEFPVEISLSPVELGGRRLVMSAIRDITDRRRAEEQVRGLLEFAPDAMIVLDDGGRIVLANAQAERLFGFTRSELSGRPIEMLVPERFRGAHVSHREDYTGAPHSRPMGAGLELYGRRKDGSEFPVEISLSPFAGSDQTLILSAVRDITERKQAEQARIELMREQAARAEAEAASAAKDQFLSILSHELRTPLTPIVGYSQLLLSRRLQGEQARIGLETIAQSAQAQLRLIEDILDVSRIITGKLAVEHEPVGLAPVVTAALDTVRSAAEEKDVRLTHEIDRSIGLVMGDSTRLQQVVWNLLINAIKFTPSGGHVHLRLAADGPNARITITDTGAGISAAMLPRIFDRFIQADSSSMRHHGGLGLGLAIVRHLVDLHGGTVEASSPGEGQGATFTVTIPRLLSVAQSLDPLFDADDLFGSRPQTGRLTGIRVLVVEDHPETRDLLRVVFEGEGATVEAVTSAPEALAIFDQDRPDVLVSDIGLPGQDGYALLRAVHERDPADPPPAVALTAYAGEEDRRLALDAGYQLHLAKPLEPDRVVAAIASMARAR